MKMKIENLKDLFVHTLKDIYFAERQIVKALPKMIKTAHSKELAKALEGHLEETKEQVVRLEKVFKLVGAKAEGEECPAIEGILDEAEELMSEIHDPEPGCSDDRRRAGRRALRNHALRHADRLG